MKFLLEGMTELGYDQLLAVNGGCSGSCSGSSAIVYGAPVMKTNISTFTGCTYVPVTASSGRCGGYSANIDFSTSLVNAINKNLDKKTNAYKSGTNDCDIWVEKVLKEAGLDISSKWGAAISSDVSDHEKKLANLTTDYAKNGWNVVLMTDSKKYSTNHCGLAKVENDGSVSFYQNTKSAGGPVVEKYKSVSAFQKAYAYTDFDYWNIASL